MIDIWVKPFSVNNPILSRLNLEKLNYIDPVDYSLLPTNKIEWVRLIAVVSCASDCDQIISDAKKYDINHIIFISAFEIHKYENQENLIIKNFIYVDSEYNNLNKKTDQLSYFTDDEYVYNTNSGIDFFWPNFHFNEQNFSALKINEDRKRVVVPFSVYNPDSEIGVNFNPIGRCLSKTQFSDKVDISIVIPHYDNLNNLYCVLRNIQNEIAGLDFNIEVILVDDGSLCDNDLIKIKFDFDLTFIQLPRNSRRIMGDSAYRAGVARNLGALYSSGQILVFQDCDILLSSEFLSCLPVLHRDYSLVMPRRIQLTKGVAKSYRDIQVSDVSTSQDSYWSEFYNNTIDWNRRAASWKYVSSYCLSIQSQLFFETGGFSSSFVGYGCEDVDLGYRLFLKNRKFHLSKENVYHLQPNYDRSEYNYSSTVRQGLLRRAYYYLYKRSYSEEVFKELILGKQK